MSHPDLAGLGAAAADQAGHAVASASGSTGIVPEGGPSTGDGLGLGGSRPSSPAADAGTAGAEYEHGEASGASPISVASSSASRRFDPIPTQGGLYTFEACTPVAEFLQAACRKKLTEPERKELRRTFPRPSCDAAATPHADDFLVDLLGSKSRVTSVDGPRYKVEDSLLDCLGPILGLWQEIEAEGLAVVDASHVVGCAQRTVQLVGHLNASIISERREALAKELGPNVQRVADQLAPPTGTDLFGEAFTDRISEKAKVQNAVADVMRSASALRRETGRVSSPRSRPEGSRYAPVRSRSHRDMRDGAAPYQQRRFSPYGGGAKRGGSFRYPVASRDRPQPRNPETSHGQSTWSQSRRGRSHNGPPL